MRKSGKPKGKGGLSVYERHEKQKQASKAGGGVQAKNAPQSHSQDIELSFSEGDSRKVLPPAKAAEDDIELSFGEEAEDAEDAHPDSNKQASSPHKSLKLTKSQSPNSKVRQEVKEADVDGAQEEQVRSKQRKSRKKSEGPDKARRKSKKKASRQESELSEAQRRMLPAEGHASLSSEQPPGRSAAEVPLEPLHQDDIRSGLAEVLPGLQERLVHPCGGEVTQMAIRPSLEQVQQKLEKLLGNTVDIPGENNSVLLVGPRGVGKTLAVERAARRLREKFNVDKDNPRVGFVKLSGLAHTDERAAFKEVARQLCRTFNCQFSKQASLEDNLGFLRDMLKELRRGHKVVVFVLDEFDLFARKPRQTLLYNLLDAMQASDMQAAVVGMSCRSDVTEMLEKRVKSRFSYRRQLVLDPCTSDFHNPQEGPLAILASLLATPNDPDSRQGTPSFRQHFQQSVGQALQDGQVQERLQRLCDKGCGSPRELGKVASLAVGSMRLEEVLLQPRHLLQAIAAVDTAPSCQAEAVAGLSILELFLLVALCRLVRKGVACPNFQMAFDEYSSLRRGGSYRGVDETAPKPSAFRAFERLLAASLIAYTDSRAEGRGGLREYNPVSLLLTTQELEDGLQHNRNFPPVLLEWLKKDAIASHAADD